MIALLRLEWIHLLRLVGGRAFLGTVLGVGIFAFMFRLQHRDPAESLHGMGSVPFVLSVLVTVLPLFGIAASMAPVETLVWSLPVTRVRAMAAHLLFWSVAWWMLAVPACLATTHGPGFSAGWAVTSLAFAAGIGTVAASAVLVLAAVASEGVGPGSGAAIASAFVNVIGLSMIAGVFVAFLNWIPLDSPLGAGVLALLLSGAVALFLSMAGRREGSGPAVHESAPPAPPPRPGIAASGGQPERVPVGLRTGVTLAGALRGWLLRDPMFLMWIILLGFMALLTQGGSPVGGIRLMAAFMVYVGLGIILQRALVPARPFLSLPLPREQFFRTLLRLPAQVALLTFALLVLGGTFPAFGNGFHKGTSGSSGGVRLYVEPPRDSWSGYESWEEARSRYAPVVTDSPAIVEAKLGRILEAQYGLRPDPAELRSLVGPEGGARGPGYPSTSSDAWSGAIVRVGEAFGWRIRGVLFLRSFFSTLLVATLVLLSLRGLTASHGKQWPWRLLVTVPVLAAWCLQIVWRGSGDDGGLPGPTAMALDRFLRSQGWILVIAWVPGLWVLWRSCVRAFGRMEVTDFPSETVRT